MPSKVRRRAGLAVALAAASAPLVALPTGTAVATGTAPLAISCQSATPTVRPLALTVDGQTATGLYVLPPARPKGIVVIGHGHTSDAQDMAGLAQQVATADDVITLAMDYRGTNLKTLFGWRVKEGAQDSIAATEMFDRFCPGSDAFTNVVLGISMGGNMSGLAVSSGARRDDGAPLFDYWFDVSGVTNVPEIYADALAVSAAPIPALASTGKTATAELQQEFGGTPWSNPSAYLDASPVFRTAEMKASGLKGVVVSHGVVDGEVTSDMSDQMVAALAAAGIPVQFNTSLFKTPGTSAGLTVYGYLSAIVPSYASPFAGHVSDVVLDSSLHQLQELYGSGFTPGGTSVTLADGLLGTRALVTLPRLPLPFAL